jgi:hypothetical protein
MSAAFVTEYAHLKSTEIFTGVSREIHNILRAHQLVDQDFLFVDDRIQQTGQDCRLHDVFTIAKRYYKQRNVGLSGGKSF